MTGKTPSHILQLDPAEKRLTMALAIELEADRWDKWQTLLGG